MEAVERAIIAAAQSGDRLAFTAAAQRLGSLSEAHAVVRSKAVLRMVDRVAVATLPDVLTGVEVRSAVVERADDEAEGSRDTLFGHFTKWDTWYEVDSWFEGNFMERMVRGATKKTIRENRANMRVLLNHGADPVAGDKPLGPIEELHEDDEGAYYEVPLLRDDNGELVDYVRDIAPGLRAGLYGSSFRFKTMREDFLYEAEPSDYNPKGLPERSLREVHVAEFGPVSFPANPAATASVRAAESSKTAPSNGDAGTSDHSARNAEPGSTATSSESAAAVTFTPISREEFLAWMSRS